MKRAVSTVSIILFCLSFLVGCANTDIEGRSFQKVGDAKLTDDFTTESELLLASELVIIGQVVSVGEIVDQGFEHRYSTVNVDDVLKGEKGLSEVRVFETALVTESSLDDEVFIPLDLDEKYVLFLISGEDFDIHYRKFLQSKLHF